MIKYFYTLFLSLIICNAFSQDTTIIENKRKVTLPEVFVRSGFDYKKFINQIKSDTSFYKAFKNLRILNYTSFNDVKMFDKNNTLKASLFSKTKQKRDSSCRTMQVLEETTTGDFYNNKKEYNYTTAELYASLFFTKGKICNESNTVNNVTISTDNKSGVEKHKEQLKMLFFNPGKKIPGIPFIGNKLDLYDKDAEELYDYVIGEEEYDGNFCYTFTIKPKENLSWFKKDKIVVDEMKTWFDENTLAVMKRNYTLSYKAGVYNFDVTMEAEMQKFKTMIVPKTLRYKGSFGVIFKKKEIGAFTATLFDFKEEEKTKN